MGYFFEGVIYVHADKTYTVKETALTIIHEATHARINKPNTKNQEYECYVNEYKHQGITLTSALKKSIIKYIDDTYDYLEWE